MSAGAAANAAAPGSRGRRLQPKFDFQCLMRYCGVPDMPTMATILDISVNVVRNLVARGVSWTRADELAIRCGAMPWDIWPEWALADPADWTGPSCPVEHGYDWLVPNQSGLGEHCLLCEAAAVQEVAA